MATDPKRILLDWGTSSLRASLIAADGRVLDDKSAPNGIATIANGRFEEPLRAMIGEWVSGAGPLPVYAFGMIGSRNGWMEMPYAPCPARAGDIAGLMRAMELDDSLRIIFAPGLNHARGEEAPDVMRGEEVHLFGLPPHGSSVAVLPGTHSKWALIRDGSVDAFRTFVTGELYGLLSEHSFVAAAKGGGRFDVAAFVRGLATARSEDATEGGLLARLFGIRRRLLADRLDASEAGEFLSGLLIGTEFSEARAAGWFGAGDAITLLGSGTIIARYQRAADAFGLNHTVAGTDVMIAGANRIALDYEERKHGI